MIKSLCQISSLPSWYSYQYDLMARRGLRVLALAYKKIELSSHNQLKDMNRLHVENEFVMDCKY